MKNMSIFANRLFLSAALAMLPAAALAQGSMGSQDSMSGPSMGNNLSASDKKFVLDAAKGGMAEVELGKLATEKAASDDVKKFGQRMVDDHTKANDQLKQVAQQEGIQLPTGLSSKERNDERTAVEA